MANESILIVEDSMIVSTHIRAVLINAGYRIHNVVTTGEDAVREVQKQKPDLILMDIVLAGEWNGVQATRIIQEISRVPVIYLTAMTDKQTFESAKLTGPYSYIIKPFDERDLLTRIEITLYKSKLEKEQERKRISAIIEGQELERHRVSRELHDGIGQLLTAIKLNIDNSDFPSSGTLQANAARLIGEAVDEVRRISENLMPLKVLSFDVKTCLKSLCQQAGNNETAVIFQTQDNSPAVSEIQKLTLYRIAQEGVNNALKHAGCKKIFVQLYASDEHISLSIEDDGVGFDPTRSQKGNGLKNITDRAEMLNGQAVVETSPGKGTLINVTIPVNHSE